MNQRKRILTGDRPTSGLHIGHYAGSLENRVALQDEYEQFIIIADVQALTTHFQHPEVLRRNVHELCIDYLSVGINPEKTRIFVQSSVPQIAELTVLYGMFVMVNTLRHNPTVKTEAAQYGFRDLTYGFLGYPVSQAADITFCGADLVPVGEDQLPVVEVTRKIVRRFNQLYKPVLKEPGTLLGRCPRLAGLDGRGKMSKSMGNAILLSDTKEEVLEKVRSAVTDPSRVTLRDKGNPDICMVHAYHRVFLPEEQENIASMCRNAAIGCIACKQRLAEGIDMLLSPFREKRTMLEQHPGYIREILQDGNEKARKAGALTLDQVKDAMHLGH
ncbi:MAG: tryptophan--tRNA ligase [Clostridia bacterium]